MIFLEFGTVVEHWPLRQWKDLMLVCRRWRDILMAHTKLWSFVTSEISLFGRNGLTLEQRLQRSAGAALTCEFRLLGGHTSALSDLAIVLAGHGHRVKSLNLTGNYDDLQTALGSVGDLPMLSELQIRRFSEDEDRSSLAPHRFMTLNLPHVRRLELHNVRFTAHDLLSNLYSLRLRNHKGQDVAFLPSFKNVIDILARSPRLERLELSSFWRENDRASNALTVGDPVMLSHLEHIDVSGGIRYLTVLLKTLAVPTTTKMSFDIPDDLTGLDIRDFLVPLRRLLHRQGVQPLRSLAIAGATPSYLNIVADTAQHCEGIPPPRSIADGPLFALTTKSIRGRDVRSIIIKVLNMLPLDPMTALCLDVHWARLDTSHAMKTWIAICQLLPQLTHVVGAMDAGVVVLIQGMTKAMGRGTKGVSGRRRRHMIEQNPLHPMALTLHCHRRTGMPDEIATPETYQHYDGLVLALQNYRDAELPGKPKDVLWDKLEFAHPEEKEERFPDLYDNMDRLRLVTRRLDVHDDGTRMTRMRYSDE